METRNSIGRKAGLPATIPAIAAVLVLALAFGALGAALSLGKAVLWDDPPFQEPARLVELSGILEEKGEIQPWAIGHLDLIDWRKQNQVFESLNSFTTSEGIASNLRTPRGVERLKGEMVSQGYFATLGIEPALGRFFTVKEDTEPYVHPVVVLGHDLWRRELDGDRSVVGRKVKLNDKDWTVIGVAPEGFRGLTDTAELWIPSSMVPGPEYIEVRRLRWLNGVGRLKPGVTVEQAQADLNRITAALEKQYPDQNKGIGVTVQPLRDYMFGPELKQGIRPALWAAALLLLLAAVDAAGLLRRGAPSLRRSVGIAVAGAVLGLALAAWAVQALMPTSGFQVPSFARLAPGAAIAAGLLALAVVCGLLVGALARWRQARLLVGLAAAAQVVLAVLFLVRANALSGEYRQAKSLDLGYRTDNLLTLRLDLDKPQYAKNEDVSRIATEYIRRIGSLPEVEQVAITGPTMATDDWVGGFTTAEDHDNPETADGTYKVLTHGVSPGYFDLMGIPLVKGRVFNWQDTQGYRVILSDGMARQIWPGQDPLGKRIKFSARHLPRPWLTVIGVVGDTQYQGYFKEKRPAPDFYLSVLQQPVRMPMILNVLIRHKPGVAVDRLEPAVRREILAVTPDTAPHDVATLEERLDKQGWKARFGLRVVTLFASLAVVLALAGIFAALTGRRSEVRGLEGQPAGGESPASARQAAH